MSDLRTRAQRAFLALRRRANERAEQRSFYTPDDSQTEDQADLEDVRLYLNHLEAEARKSRST